MDIITRTEATAQGLKSYFTGKPCKHGHLSKKSTYNGGCYLCSLEYRKAARRRRGLKRNFGVSKHPMYATFNSARKRARDNNISFDLDFNLIIKNIPDICPILNIPLFWSKKQSDNSPSLDKIDPMGGYTANNVQIISWRANRIKNNGTMLEHLLIAKNILNHECPSNQKIITRLIEDIETMV